MPDRRYTLQAQARQQHMKDLLLLLASSQPLSRTQLAQRTGLSLTAVITLMDGCGSVLERVWPEPDVRRSCWN